MKWSLRTAQTVTQIVGVPAISEIIDTSQREITKTNKRFNHFCNKKALTPSYDGVPVKVAPLGKKGLHQQGEEVQAFDEEPEIVGHDAVVKENHHRLAHHLQWRDRGGGTLKALSHAQISGFRIIWHPC